MPSRGEETKRGRGLSKANPAVASPARPWGQVALSPGEGLSEASRNQLSRPPGSLALLLRPQGAGRGEQWGCRGHSFLWGPALQLETEELPSQ